MKSFLFSCGNSDTGTIGFCARVKAENKESALEILRSALPEYGQSFDYPADGDEMEYCWIYFNPDNITVEENLSEGDTEDDEEVAE